MVNDQHGSAFGASNPNDRTASASVAQLFARMTHEIEASKPPNVIHFIMDFVCKNYPEHLHGFASIWNADPDLERERQEVCRFFKAHKISTQIAAHFTNAGYDTLETLATLHCENLADIEAFNNVKWLPGHKVRLQHVFQDIEQFVRQHRQGITGGAQVLYNGGHAGTPVMLQPTGSMFDRPPAAPLGMSLNPSNRIAGPMPLQPTAAQMGGLGMGGAASVSPSMMPSLGPGVGSYPAGMAQGMHAPIGGYGAGLMSSYGK
jgi:hypothetical protein